MLFRSIIIETKGNINLIVCKNGSQKLIEWDDKTLLDGNGNVIGILAIGQDVSERKKTEQALKEKIHSSEIFHNVAVERENKMGELKKRIKQLEIGLAKQKQQ